MPIPLLVIAEGKSRAGSWQAEPSPGVLQVAAWLVREHSWDVVLEVLKHEMSHQLVDQIMDRRGEPPHGPVFQKACRRLGVHPQFRRAKSEIPRLLFGGAKELSSSSPIVVKIEKLLALAGSANEYESTLAMTKAGDLMRRHNLERLAAKLAAGPAGECGGNRVGSAVGMDYDYLVINTGRLRRLPHHRYLAALLQSFFYVNTLSYSLYEPTQDRKLQVLELLGTRENLAVAEYVYHFLERLLPRLWRRYQQANHATGKEKNSYYIGVLNGFREKLQQQEKVVSNRDLTVARDAALAADTNPAAADSTCSGLVCAGDQGLQDFLNTRFPHIRKISGKGSRLYQATYRAGQADGRKIVIHKGIHHQEGNRGRLLG